MAKGDKEKLQDVIQIKEIIGEKPYGNEGKTLFKVKALNSQGYLVEYACFNKGLFQFLSSIREPFKADIEQKVGDIVEMTLAEVAP